MKRSCEMCGGEYEAKRATAKYCSPRCRQRRHRGGQPASKPKPLEPVADLPTNPGGVEKATLAELESAGRVDTPLGQTALALARRLDGGHMDTGSSLASVAKQLTVTLAAAVEDAKVEADPVDELRAIRDRKRAAAG